MSNEQETIQEILQYYSTLQQAREDAKYWHNQYKEEIQRDYEQSIAQIQVEYEQHSRQARSIYEQHSQAAHAEAAQAIAALGILAAPWNSSLWNSFDPALRNGAEQIADSLRDLESSIVAYADTSTIPGGVRIGALSQTGIERPIKDAPILIPLIGHGHVIIMSHGAGKEKALRLLQSIVTRVVLTFPVLSARFIFIDPLGLGANFPFELLLESIRGNTVYSEADEIKAQMRELTEHLRRVTLKYLAREFDTIEAYNQEAQEVVEPYRFLCVADFPSKFDSDAATRLLSVAEKGVRTGVYILTHIDLDADMPRDFNIEALKRTATVIMVEPDKCKLQSGDVWQEFTPDDVPDNNLFNKLMRKVSLQAEQGAFQGIPFQKVAKPYNEWWSENTASLIDVPIGRTGARKLLNFWLGKQKDGRISSHALVGGKTGSGKSTLFHVLINSLAITYPPDELELYLVDFKEGVEFKPYADARLPHARVIAIESEREFGLSILRHLHAELEHRGALFKEVNAQDLTEYRKRTDKKLPRIVLIIDEFQILFSEQDTLSNKAAIILDDLARRGRAFGIHVVMGSQSVKVAHLPQGTYGQFATRIVLQSPETEVAALLGPDNVAVTELLERPGEVIYNDDGGRRDRNKPGQVAILQEKTITYLLSQINELAYERHQQRTGPQIIFQGNRPSSIADNEQLQQLYDLSGWPAAREIKDLLSLRDWIAAEKPALVWMGEAIEIKPHTAVRFRRRSRSNLLIVGDSEENIFGMLGSALISLTAFYKPGDVQFRIIDLSLKEEEWEDTCDHFAKHFSFYDVVVRERRGAAELVDEVSGIVQQRQEQYTAGEDNPGPSVFLVIAGAHRLPELRPVPGRLGGNEPSEYAKKLISILQRGPELGIYTLLWYDSAKSFDNSLSRSALAHFDRRVAFHMSKDESQLLLSDPVANTLQKYRALLLDDEQGVALEKFKPYALPSRKGDQEQEFRQYADRLRQRLVERSE